MPSDSPAVEFFITYAWAISLALIILSALFYAKANNINPLMPERVTISGGFTAIDHQVKTNKVQLVLKNNRAENVDITGITVVDLNCAFNQEVQLEPSQQYTFDIPCPQITTSKVKSDLLIQYRGESGLHHTEKGEIISKVSS